MHSRFELVADLSDSSDAETAFDLVTLATLKTDLEITGSSEDAALSARITRESELIAELCDRVFAFGSAIETFSFDSGEISRPGLALSLRMYPINEIESITINGVDSDLDGFEIDLEQGRIWIVGGGSWSGTIAIAYSGGYMLPEESPQRLQLAVIESIRDRRNRADRESGQSGLRETLHGDTRVSYFPEPASSTTSLFPPAVLDLLKSFRRLAFA